MPTYRVYLSTPASTHVEIEDAPSPEAALERALEGEKPFPMICAQCSGWGRRNDPPLELGDVWEPAIGPGEDELSCVEQVEES